MSNAKYAQSIFGDQSLTDVLAKPQAGQGGVGIPPTYAPGVDDFPPPYIPPLQSFPYKSQTDQEVVGIPPVCTVEEVANFLRLNTRTVREMFHGGELTGGQRGHTIRISRTSVLQWLSGKRPVSL